MSRKPKTDAKTVEPRVLAKEHYLTLIDENN